MKMPDNKTQSGLKDHAGNEILMEGKGGSEDIRVHAVKDMHVTVDNDREMHVKAHLKETVDKGQEVTVHQGFKETITEGATATISDGKKLTVTGGSTVDITGEYKTTVTGPTKHSLDRDDGHSRNRGRHLYVRDQPEVRRCRLGDRDHADVDQDQHGSIDGDVGRDRRRRERPLISLNG